MAFIKKLLVKTDQSISPKRVNNPDIQPIGSFLQHKFSRGINYNMKIVIRGDRNVGKSALFTRLKGEPFNEQYNPSTEIQVASIHWNDKKHTDVIKVEVWDVVDKGKPRTSIQGLKFQNSAPQNIPEACLDASFLDVYKGAHGVILVMDMTKSWTFDYVCRELPRVPPDLPVLILSNHRDMGHHRTVTEDQVRSFLEDEAAGRASCNPANAEQSKLRGKRLVPVQYCEASMRNGFGLVYVHRFFSVPFLCLRQSVLQKQLQLTQLELAGTVRDLSAIDGPLATTTDAYNTYVRIRRERDRQTANNVFRLSGETKLSLGNQDCTKSDPMAPLTHRSTATPISTARTTTWSDNHPIQSKITTTSTERPVNSRSDTTSSVLAKPGEQQQFNPSDGEDEDEDDDFVLSTSVTAAVPESASRPRRFTNPKVLTLQEDVDPGDLFPARLLTPPDTESWENVNLSLASRESSDAEDGHTNEGLPIQGSSSPEVPSRSVSLSQRNPGSLIKQTDEFGRTRISYPKQGSFDSVNNETDPHELSNQSSSSPRSPKAQFMHQQYPEDAHTEYGGYDESLIQSVINSHEDEDALERFLAEQ